MLWTAVCGDCTLQAEMVGDKKAVEQAMAAFRTATVKARKNARGDGERPYSSQMVIDEYQALEDVYLPPGATEGIGMLGDVHVELARVSQSGALCCTLS